MRAWFSTPQRIARLHASAESWLGTPFSANGSTKGERGGVSCQKLIGSIYREVGCADIAIPEAPMCHWKFSRESLIEKFMATIPDRVALLEEGRPTRDLQPGDLLGFRLGQCVHHLGIALSLTTFVHCMTRAEIAHLTDPTWLSRYACAWRPIEPWSRHF